MTAVKLEDSRRVIRGEDFFADKDHAYLGGEPADDGRFLAAFAHALEHTVDIRRLRRSAWPGHCSQMFCLMTDPTRPASFPMTAGRSPTMGSILSRSHKWKGHGGRRRPTAICYSSFPMWGHLTKAA